MSKFVIEKYDYYGTTYTLRLPIFPWIPYPYFKHELGTRHNDEMLPTDEDAKKQARSIIRSKTLRYGSETAERANFEFVATYGK